MPTGYTHDVQTGKVTDFPTFAMRCARNFGALLMMRDSAMDATIPEQFEPSDYNFTGLREAEARLMALRSMSPDEIDAAYRADQDRAVRERDDFLQRKETERSRYEAMLEKVRAWEPPTADHVGMKKFMVDQLVESIKFDCGGDWQPSVPCDGATQWWQGLVKRAEKDIVYHTAAHTKEIESTESRNRWVRDLRESLLRGPK